MKPEIELTLAQVAQACRDNDVRAVAVGVTELREQLDLVGPGQSIGPATAFRTLKPAGDLLGRALLDLDAASAWLLLTSLAVDDAPEMRCIACYALGRLGTRDTGEALTLAHVLAADPSWEVREFVANALDEVLAENRGDAVYVEMEQWVHDPNPNVRRVPTNALMRYGRKHPQRVLRLMRLLLHDESVYVRENVVFCLGVIGAERVPAIGGAKDASRPDLLLAALAEWQADDDERARWIIARTLGRSWAASRVQPAKALLQTLLTDPHKKVQLAAAASLRELDKHKAT